MFGRVGRLCLAGLYLFCAPLLAAPSPLAEELARVAPGLNPQALRDAVAAMQCAVEHGAEPARRLAVIDYSQPSTARRLWIFDLQQRRLLLRDYVAHGRLSGENYASQFSNRLGSHQSSLGLFRTAESYFGKHGYSLRMDGLDPGINDLARQRAIVIHGAAYVNPKMVSKHGRIGRSLGCPAVRPEVARLVVDKLKGGQFLLAWHADPRWLNRSALLACKSPRLLQSALRPLPDKG
ncbi:murein L,D-transpeptidase catalytic domain family protein [Pseudomonas sp. CAU 1711]|uniref:murein L,D-transpeptidase catalytic domain family protein n=1 Tax=Pseudomonas sp. CAU 1711 TaxID=3140356 RepID=UPI00325FF74C